MKQEKFTEALEHISDVHIAEAGKLRHHNRTWIPVVAAAAALLLVIGLANAGAKEPPVSIQETTVPAEPVDQSLFLDTFTPEEVALEFLLASPQYPTLRPFPTDQSDYDLWAQYHNAWSDARRNLHTAPADYANNLTAFWTQSISQYLSDSAQKNAAYSPISLYMALSMLAQTTDGASRQEILQLLGTDNIEALSQQAKLIFENHYENDGVHTSILANSLWLDDAFSFNEEAVKMLAENSYASVYRGALESPELNIALKDWLNAQTGGLLEDSIQELDGMDEMTALVIASTINYRCKWVNAFSALQNEDNVFYSPAGERTVTYMHGSSGYAPYFWGDDFSATYLSLDDGSRMWLILPEEGYTPEDLLSSGNALNMLFSYSIYGEYSKDAEIYPNQKDVTVNVTLPKFDICGDLDLMAGLKKLGVRQVTDPVKADFSAIESYEQQLFLGRAQQSTRVSIDEEGLTGVAYTVLGVPAMGAPPTEEVDLVLDRPFLFVVESEDGLPLFAGIVNEP